MLELKDYQRVAVERIVQRQRIIVGDERGLGKTATVLTAIKRLLGDIGGQALVFVPSVGLGVWQDEAMKWINEHAIIYSGEDPLHIRKIIWEEFKDTKPFLLVATYPMAKEIYERQVGWQALICDEYHRVGLMNHKSATHKMIRKFRTRIMIPITGTPVRKGPQDLFAPLNLIDSFAFGSYWQFIGKHCIRINDTFGYTIEDKPKNPREFNAMLKPMFIYRTKKAVLKELPPKTRAPIKLRMTPKQEQMYNQLWDTLVMKVDDNKTIVAPNQAVKILYARQLLVTPQIFGSKEVGAAIPALIQNIEDEFDVKRSVAVCTPFKAGIPFIKEAIEKKLTKKVYVIHGDIKTPARDVARAFQNNKDHDKVILYTVTSGMAFDAYEASTGFFVGYEWSAIDNLQAEDRMHRIGQLDPVNIYYFLHTGTVDEHVMSKLDDKTMAANWVLHTQEVLRRKEDSRAQNPK